MRGLVNTGNLGNVDRRTSSDNGFVRVNGSIANDDAFVGYTRCAFDIVDGLIGAQQVDILLVAQSRDELILVSN